MIQTGAQPSSAQQREPSMEEILASIRRIIEDSDTVRAAADEQVEALAPQPQELEIEAFRAGLDDPEQEAASATAEAENDIAEMPADIPAFSSAQAMTQPAVTPAEVADGPEPASSPALSRPQEQPATPSEPAVESRPATAIVSDSTGRQVAAAFGELSEAFAASRRRSFDEMAQEMLRPMLQDWLDNNLPTLVERLVREEIERVARGDQR